MLILGATSLTNGLVCCIMTGKVTFWEKNMSTKILLPFLLIANIVLSCFIVQSLTLLEKEPILPPEMEKELENHLRKITALQAKKLSSIMARTKSVVEASATFSKLSWQNPHIPLPESYYHNDEVSKKTPQKTQENKTYNCLISKENSCFKIAPSAFLENYRKDYLRVRKEVEKPFDHLDLDMKEAILDTAKMDIIWKELYEQYPEHKWLYMGYEKGFHRSFPWHRYQARTYDPRVRSWYVGAVSGGKDVVLVIDTSGSMKGVPLRNTKTAMEDVLKTLGPQDRLTIIHFSSTVKVFQPNLEIATEAFVKKCVRYIDSLEAKGGTNINDSISQALDILKNQGNSSRTPVVIFMTDGEATAGEKNREAIQKNILAKNDFGVRIFVFGLGTQLDFQLLENIARQNKGADVYVQDSQDLIDAMKRYYQFFKIGKSVVWSWPYVDANGLGMVMAASKAVTVEGKFIGVVSADVSLVELIGKLKTFKTSPNSYNFIFDSGGVTALHPSFLNQAPGDWQEDSMRVSIEDLETNASEFIALKDKVIRGLPAIGIVPYGEEKKIVVMQPIAQSSLFFASVVPVKDLTGQPKKGSEQLSLLWPVMIASGMGFLITALGAWRLNLFLSSATKESKKTGGISL